MFPIAKNNDLFTFRQCLGANLLSFGGALYSFGLRLIEKSNWTKARVHYCVILAGFWTSLNLCYSIKDGRWEQYNSQAVMKKKKHKAFYKIRNQYHLLWWWCCFLRGRCCSFRKSKSPHSFFNPKWFSFVRQNVGAGIKATLSSVW